MSSYYYLISSLPTLQTDEKPPITYEEFLEQCRSTVSESTYKRLESIIELPKARGLLIGFAEFSNALKEELNYQRKLWLGKDCEEPENRKIETIAIAETALKSKNPLEAETYILKKEFEKLDSLVSMHFFDDYVLYGYAIKLKLLERKSVFEKERGQAEFQRLFDNLQAQILTI